MFCFKIKSFCYCLLLNMNLVRIKNYFACSFYGFIKNGTVYYLFSKGMQTFKYNSVFFVRMCVCIHVICMCGYVLCACM